MSVRAKSFVHSPGPSRVDSSARPQIAGHVCDRGGRAFPPRTKASGVEDRIPPVVSRSCENLSTEQLDFPAFEAKLQIRNGAVHHLALFRAKGLL
jgi:hypothetical protein